MNSKISVYHSFTSVVGGRDPTRGTRWLSRGVLSLPQSHFLHSRFRLEAVSALPWAGPTVRNPDSHALSLKRPTSRGDAQNGGRGSYSRENAGDALRQGRAGSQSSLAGSRAKLRGPGVSRRSVASAALVPSASFVSFPWGNAGRGGAGTGSLSGWRDPPHLLTSEQPVPCMQGRPVLAAARPAWGSGDGQGAPHGPGRGLAFRLGWVSVGLYCRVCSVPSRQQGQGPSRAPQASRSVGLEAVPSGQRAGRAGGVWEARQLLLPSSPFTWPPWSPLHRVRLTC